VLPEEIGGAIVGQIRVVLLFNEDSERQKEVGEYLKSQKRCKTALITELVYAWIHKDSKTVSSYNNVNVDIEELKQQLLKDQEFMQQKDSLPTVIAERRQKELEDMMQRQEQFQAKAQQDMEKANNDLMAPVYKKLDDAIKAVGAAEGVIYIFDMARTPIPYINENQSINLTPKVKTQLGIK